jgi:predicted MPP superfamily phosphohydrolase/ubiquinone/menaquinone biosynthesis C-methylase UbiE
MNRRRISHRALFKTALGSVLLGIGGLVYAREVEPFRIAVERVTLTLPRLAPPFDGYRIVQVSDVHLDGWMTPERLERIVDLVNEQSPNLVAITGDFVSSYSARYVPGLLGPLGRLEAPDGAVAVLGNHDHWAGAEEVRRAISSTGVADVSNGMKTLRRDGAVLHLCGVDSVFDGVDRLDEVLESLESAEPGCSLLLAHEPDFADRSAVTGRFDLQISGHSHGGQVRVPFLGAPLVPPLSRKYPSGLYRVGKMLQYTNRGLGIMYTRVRVNCRPEITVFTLRTLESGSQPPIPAKVGLFERLGRSSISSNVRVYDRIGALYDAAVGPISRRFRDRAVAALELGSESRLLVVGVGSGLDLPHLPRDVRGMGIDLSDGMLRRANKRLARLGMPNFELRKMDAQRLDLPDASFDAVYLPLIVAVASNGPRVLAEAARVAKPGARLVVVDKFLPEERSRSTTFRQISDLLGDIVTYIDRYFSEIHTGAPELEILGDEPLALGGFFRLITLQKPVGKVSKN